jgi:MFS family permease
VPCEKGPTIEMNAGSPCEEALDYPESADVETLSRHSVTGRIISTAALIFSCYFVIGLQLSVVPGFVHVRLGYSALLAGLSISVQYLATLAVRPIAGRMGDTIGAKRTTSTGLLVSCLSGLLFALCSLLAAIPWASLSLLVLARLTLGFGESWVATGGTLWGISRLGAGYEARVISWAGIAAYGAIATGAPVGVWLERGYGAGAIGLVSVLVALAAFLWSTVIPAVKTQAGELLPFSQVLKTVLPDGMGLALAGIGFGTIAAFISLYYANRDWHNAGLSLSFFGVSFVTARLLFADTINRFGGYKVAIVSLVVETSGLLLLWAAANPALALAGAGLTGFGFSLVFPALGVEAVRRVPTQSQGSALGIYTAFVDLSLGISGPLAGTIVGAAGYPAIFLFAALMAMASMALLVTLSRKPVERASRT